MQQPERILKIVFCAHHAAGSLLCSETVGQGILTVAGGPAEHLHASDHGKRGHDTQFLIRERTCDALVSLDPRLGKIGSIRFMFDETQR